MRCIGQRPHRLAPAVQRGVEPLDRRAQGPLDLAGGGDAADIDVAGAVDEILEVGAQLCGSRSLGDRRRLRRLRRANHHAVGILGKRLVVDESVAAVASPHPFARPDPDLAVGRERPPGVAQGPALLGAAVMFEAEERRGLEVVALRTRRDRNALGASLVHVAVEAEIEAVGQVDFLEKALSCPL